MLFRAIPAVLLLLALPALSAPPTEEQLLSRMDQAATSFQAMTAHIRQISHTEVINDNSEETGSVAMVKTGSKEFQGLIEYSAPDQKVMLFANKQLEIYNPKTNIVQVIDLGKHGEQIAQFFMVGFGTSGKDIAKSYDVSVTGTEQVLGQTTTKLELIPKSAEAKQYLTKMEMWIPAGSSYPVQEKLYQPSGDYTLWTYHDVKINPVLAKDALESKIPANAKRENMQK